MLIAVSALGRNLRVEWVDFYGDGTMTASIADHAGQRTHVCFDGRANSPTRHRLFQQARHPRQDGAVLVELGEPEEGTVVSLLSRWLDSAGPRALDSTEWGWGLARDALLHLGDYTV